MVWLPFPNGWFMTFFYPHLIRSSIRCRDACTRHGQASRTLSRPWPTRWPRRVKIGIPIFKSGGLGELSGKHEGFIQGNSQMADAKGRSYAIQKGKCPFFQKVEFRLNDDNKFILNGNNKLKQRTLPFGPCKMGI